VRSSPVEDCRVPLLTSGPADPIRVMSRPDLNGPPFGQQQTGLWRRQVEDVTNTVVAQRHVVDALCELLCQAHLHYVGCLANVVPPGRTSDPLSSC
jgi:hypothetical protein